MVRSQSSFLIRLYEEYLEDAAFYYAQRRTFLSKEDTPWAKIERLEERTTAALEGLEIGGALAVDVCCRHLSSDDPGELYAALRILCRRNCRDLVFLAVESIDLTDGQKATAVSDALKCEMPIAWEPDFNTMLDAGDGRVAPLLASVLAYRRVLCSAAIMRAIERCPTPALSDMVWAMGRSNDSAATNILLDYLRSHDEPIRHSAAIALVRLGDLTTVDYCLDQAATQDWPLYALALSGGRFLHSRIMELARIRQSREIVWALGLFGDPASVELLLDLLATQDFAESSANALYAITAAPLSETVFVPDEMQEPEIFKGKIFGSRITRISQEVKVWRNWWVANKHRFIEGLRYRQGRLISPAVLLELQTAESSSRFLREFGLDELATRYGIDTGLETDMFAQRKALLTKTAEAFSLRSAHIKEGLWYFAGRPIQ